MKHGEFYLCKRLRLLEFLRSKGFIPEQTLPDCNNPKYLVWRFRNSVELEAAIDSYFEQIKKKNEA